MRICVFGAGAIGGHIAVRLAMGGAAVSVVARGPQLAAIQAQGLTVQAPDGTLHSRPRASADPADLGPQDAVLVTVKAPSLPRAVAQMAPLLGAETSVTFLTNGVPWWYFHGHGGPLADRQLDLLDPEGNMWRLLGMRTVGGIAWPASSVPEPGVVRVMSPKSRATILGAIDGITTPAIIALAEAFRLAGLPVQIDTLIRDRIWEKLAFNLSAGPMCVLTETPVRDTHMEPSLVAASRRVVAEVATLVRALGCDSAIEVERMVNINTQLTHRPSILQDLMAHRPMEIDALYTVPLQLAAMMGVAMPTLELLAALIRVKATGRGQTGIKACTAGA
jgi:2-dehydropantoate 2-reductase